MLCCGFTLVAEAEESPKYFAIWLNNGQRIDMLLSEKPNVKFEEGTLKFEASATAVEYKASDVKEFTLEATQSTGIHSMKADGKDCSISQSDNMLNILGAEPYAKFLLYNAAGVLVSTNTADGTGTLSISLDRLGRGTYILKNASTTFKILKR